MIKIKVTRKQIIKELKVSGHSIKKEDLLVDPLCATVSAVILGTVNYFKNKKEYDDQLKIIIETNSIQFLVLKENSIILEILENVLVQLQTIENYFKKDIKIFEKEK